MPHCLGVGVCASTMVSKTHHLTLILPNVHYRLTPAKTWHYSLGQKYLSLQNLSCKTQTAIKLSHLFTRVTLVWSPDNSGLTLGPEVPLAPVTGTLVFLSVIAPAGY